MRTVKRLICFAAVIGCLLMIFWFSSQNGLESGSVSGRLVRWVLSRIPAIRERPDFEQIVRAFHPLTRKLGHMTEFALLGASLMLLFRQFPLPEWVRWFGTVGGGILTAAGDEVHQLFVPDRAGNPVDVMIDLAGLVIGAAAVYIAAALMRRARRKESP